MTFVAIAAVAVAFGAAGWWLARGTPASCVTPVDGVETVRYVERDGTAPALTSLDIHASPDAEGCPVLIWVHGGSWQAGDKSSRLTRVKAEHFVAQGWVFVSVNYRLAAEDNDVRWPAFGDDVAAAVRWVRDDIRRFGGDPERISLIGHSSGAHLVSIVGTNEELLGRNGSTIDDVRCVVSLDSVTHDLTDPPPWEVDIIDLAFPDDEAMVDGSPTLQAPTTSATPPAFLIVTRGRQERLDSSARLAETLRAAGGSADVADLTPYDHGEVSSELGVPGEQRVTPIVDRFLDTCGRPDDPVADTSTPSTEPRGQSAAALLPTTGRRA